MKNVRLQLSFATVCKSSYLATITSYLQMLLVAIDLYSYCSLCSASLYKFTTNIATVSFQSIQLHAWLAIYTAASYRLQLTMIRPRRWKTSVAIQLAITITFQGSLRIYKVFCQLARGFKITRNTSPYTSYAATGRKGLPTNNAQVARLEPILQY